MSTIPQLLTQAALEVRRNAASAAAVGLDAGDLDALADRLIHATRYTPEQIAASMRALAGLFGDERDAWAAVSPAFVALMDAIQQAPG